MAALDSNSITLETVVPLASIVGTGVTLFRQNVRMEKQVAILDTKVSNLEARLGSIEAKLNQRLDILEKKLENKMDTEGFYRLDAKCEALILALIGSKQSSTQQSPPQQSQTPKP